MAPISFGSLGLTLPFFFQVAASDSGVSSWSNSLSLSPSIVGVVALLYDNAPDIEWEHVSKVADTSSSSETLVKLYLTDFAVNLTIFLQSACKLLECAPFTHLTHHPHYHCQSLPQSFGILSQMAEKLHLILDPHYCWQLFWIRIVTLGLAIGWGHFNRHQSQYVPHPYLCGNPCDLEGNPLPPNTPKPDHYVGLKDSWAPFGNQAKYLLMDFLFQKEEISAPNIDFLMELWTFKAAKYEEDSPFKSHHDVYATIDVICAMLVNPDFARQFDYTPYDTVYKNDPSTDGSMQAHHNAVTPVGFLAIPKADHKYDNNVQFWTIKHQLYHSSLDAILKSLEDYSEQVMLAGIMQNWCVKCTALPEDLDESTAKH
ncbi:hypothetical protein EDB19DRAFT_1830231 [Suillus lakei]|nr:hypothetical protein EDB19DRAFT_1830231 [Suillus lakei]